MIIAPGFLEKILVEFGSLFGYASVVSMLINVGKKFGWVKDGTADKWLAGASLAGVVTLYILRLVVPDFNIVVIDTTLGEIALAGTYVLGFVGMLLTGKATYFADRGLPLIGTSNSQSQIIMAVSSSGGGEIKEAEATIIDTARHPE